MDFKANGFMYALGGIVVVFVIVQSVFFIAKAWKHAKELGIETAKLKNTVVSSILFTIAPAISILATVFALEKALGIVLPWIRLSVIGNLAYETTAAQTALDYWGTSISSEVTDPQQFSTITWAMTLGCIVPLLLLPFVCKKLQKKIGKAINKTEGTNEKQKKLVDSASAAAFIGIISAFVARAIAGTTNDEKTLNAGFMSISVLLVSIVTMVVLETLCKKFKLEKLEPFAMPIAMFAGMGAAILFEAVLPDAVTQFVWR